ncbi:MAG: hypothetical protein RL138_309 [Bacteroidota bacterium]
MSILPASVQLQRNYLQKEFTFSNWDDLAPHYNELLQRNLDSAAAIEQWLKDKSELDSVVEEESRWRYVRLTCYTNDESIKKSYTDFVNDIKPHLIEVRTKLNAKLLECPSLAALDKAQYATFLAGLQASVKLQEEKNIEQLRNLELKEQEYASITGNLSIEHEGKELTLPEAGNLLAENDRDLRETIYRKVQAARLAVAPQLEDLFDDLVRRRQEIAERAGFANYRDYRMTELVRVDYTPADCMQFHESIRQSFLPLVNKLNRTRKNALGLEKLRPWDGEVDLNNAAPLKPFVDGKDLTNKTIECLEKIDPYFAACLTRMQEMGRLDLDSRKGKAPGGYNMSLPETNVPFIFMNAASSVRDLITMVHESGHAVHSFLSADLPLREYKDYPSEIAEVASMSMELFTMEHWQLFFENEADYKRAKEQQFQRIITIFPWVAIIDRYQQWIYTNPGHTREQRLDAWKEIFSSFSSEEVDYSGLEESVKYRWHAQIHLFDYPFYYIEYAIAQLGAIAMWKQWKEKGAIAIENYKESLKLGYSVGLPALFERAGVRFDFSPAYVQELADFLEAEMNKL